MIPLPLVGSARVGARRVCGAKDGDLAFDPQAWRHTSTPNPSLPSEFGIVSQEFLVSPEFSRNVPGTPVALHLCASLHQEGEKGGV